MPLCWCYFEWHQVNLALMNRCCLFNAVYIWACLSTCVIIHAEANFSETVQKYKKGSAVLMSQQN